MFGSGYGRNVRIWALVFCSDPDPGVLFASRSWYFVWIRIRVCCSDPDTGGMFGSGYGCFLRIREFYSDLDTGECSDPDTGVLLGSIYG